MKELSTPTLGGSGTNGEVITQTLLELSTPTLGGSGTIERQLWLRRYELSTPTLGGSGTSKLDNIVRIMNCPPPHLEDPAPVHDSDILTNGTVHPHTWRIRHHRDRVDADNY